MAASAGSSCPGQNGTSPPTACQPRPPKAASTSPSGAGERLHLRSDGPAVTFALEGSRYDYAYVTPQGAHCVVAAGEDLRLLPRVTKGQVQVTGDWRRDHADNVAMAFSGPEGFEATIDLFQAIPPAPATESFDQARSRGRR